MVRRSILALTAGLLTATTFAAAAEERVAFPSGYAQTFTNYLSLDRVQNPDQIIRLFANPAAREAAAAGQPLPEGSVLVGEIYAAKKGKDGNILTSSLGRRIRDKFVAVAVMEKRAGWGDSFPADLRNGDWDFAIFSPDGKRLEKDLNTCRTCHAPLKDSQHLFSLEHLAAK